MKIAIQGVLREPEAATVSALDRGFLYGDGVFEVLRTYGGVPFALEEHMGRLYASSRRVAMSLPVPIARLIAEVREVLGAVTHGESSVRVVVTRGVGEPGLDLALAKEPTRVVIAAPLRLPPRTLWTEGQRVVTLRAARDVSASALSTAKTLNYLTNILALHEARTQGAGDVLFVAGDDVIESASANVFVVENGVVTTPPLDAGVLPGVTRRFVIEAARARGFTVREARVRVSDLWTADEVFLTSSLREVVPVVEIDAHEVGTAAPGEITRTLHRAFRDLTPGAGTALPWE